MTKDRGGATVPLNDEWKQRARDRLNEMGRSHAWLAAEIRRRTGSDPKKNRLPSVASVTRMLKDQKSSSWAIEGSLVLGIEGPLPGTGTSAPETDPEWAILRDLDPSEYHDLLERVQNYIQARQALKGGGQHAVSRLHEAVPASAVYRTTTKRG